MTGDYDSTQVKLEQTCRIIMVMYDGSDLRIDKCVITTEVSEVSASIIDDKSWREHYRIWEHAKRLLELPSSTEQDCSAALFQLNRAVDFRDKFLAGLYSFKRIPGLSNGHNQHELMCQLGLILPTMKTKLDAIRNRLMHQPEARPPAQSVCRELMEFTWYYLRSTDRLCSEPADDFVTAWRAEDRSSDCRFYWEIDRGSWAVRTSGWIPEHLIRAPEDNDALTLRLQNEPRGDPARSKILLRDAELVAPQYQVRRIIDLHFAITLDTIG